MLFTFAGGWRSCDGAFAMQWVTASVTPLYVSKNICAFSVVVSSYPTQPSLWRTGADDGLGGSALTHLAAGLGVRGPFIASVTCGCPARHNPNMGYGASGCDSCRNRDQHALVPKPPGIRPCAKTGSQCERVCCSEFSIFAKCCESGKMGVGPMTVNGKL